MNVRLVLLMVFVGAMTFSGCVDCSLTKRDDGRYVAGTPLISPSGAINVPGDRLPTSVLPSSVSKQPVSTDYTLVPVESSREQKQREAQDKLEEDLASLDRK